MNRQSGLALLEALLASALLGVGLLGAVGLTVHALKLAQHTRQAVQAQALASDTLACATAGMDCPSATTHTVEGVRYTVVLQHIPAGDQLTELQVRVQWDSVAGPQSLLWRSRMSAMPDWLGVSSP